jgi:acyl-CoA synthetase (AMP-forming)/AMP-acid ligase II
VDGELQIHTATAMMGYLNAPSPFTEDGWLRTGDEAVVEGGYIRILGRRSEIINVGGWKVYPAEVESVLEEMDGIEAAVVTGEVSGITGQQVKATVRLANPSSLKELRRAIWAYCQDKLPAYKIPQKIVITEEALVSSRMKKVRKQV